MTPHDTLRSLLLTPAVRALVDEKVYDVSEVPQGTAEPYITFQRVSHPRTHASAGPVDLSAPIFQVEGWATDQKERLALETAIRDACDEHASPGSPGALADGGIDEIELATEGQEDHTRVVRFEVQLLVFAT
jgi:hypothetical protein